MFKTLIKDNELDNLHQIINNGDDRYVCFTSFDKSWHICITNGVDVWRLQVNEDEFKTYKELSNISADEAFCLKIRNSFKSGDLSAAEIGTKVKLDIGKGDSAIHFELFEAKSLEKKNDLKSILLRLAESSLDNESKLKTANQTIEKLRSEKNTSGANAFIDSSSKKGANMSKSSKPKKVGMSVVNPNSKKRKVATGVVFE